MTPAPVLIALTALLILLNGCSSSFVGHKLGLTRDKQKPIDKTGIPITMNRPEFQLTVAKEKVGTKEQLVSTIAVKWVPDNAQRYTLSLDPGFLSKSSFTHTFDKDGNFTAGAGSVESQVVTTIATLGELAGSFLSLGILDASRPAQLLREEIEQSEDPACTTTHQSDLFSSYPAIPNETVGKVIALRWKRYEEDGGRIEEGGGEARVLNRIHFTSQQERDCFQAIRKRVSEVKTTNRDQLQSAFATRLEEFKFEHNKNTKYQSAKGEVEELLRNHDHVALTKLYKQLSDDTKGDYDGGEFGDSQRLLAQRAKEIAKAKSNQFSKVVLDGILQMPSSVWRARQTLELSARIASVAVEGAQYPPGFVRSGYENLVKELNAELNHILGTSLTTTQISNLEAYLVKEVPLAAGPNVQRYAVEDRAKVVSQLEALRAEHKGTMSLVIGMNEPIRVPGNTVSVPGSDACNCPSLPAPTADLKLVTNLVIPTADADFVKQTKDELPPDAPPYLLVIESTNGLAKRMTSEQTDEPAEGEK